MVGDVTEKRLNCGSALNINLCGEPETACAYSQVSRVTKLIQVIY